MATPAQAAFAEGFSALLEEHGTTWSIGGRSFAGVASTLKPDDQRLPGSGDRVIELQTFSRAIRLIRPRRGDELLRAGLLYRISKVDHDHTTGISTLLIVPASAYETAMEDDTGELLTDESGVAIDEGRTP